jgi:hypothetical protein
MTTTHDEATDRATTDREDEDLLTRLVREHREAAALLTALQRRTGSDAGDSVDTVRALITDLVRHSVGERTHLVPLVREHLPDGETVAARMETGSERLERELQQLERLPMRGDFWIHLKIVESLVTQHAGELEQYVFPRIAAATPADELAQLGQRAARTARVGPTHPHPNAPREGAALAAAAPGAGLVDRVRDLFTS